MPPTISFNAQECWTFVSLKKNTKIKLKKEKKKKKKKDFHNPE